MIFDMERITELKFLERIFNLVLQNKVLNPDSQDKVVEFLHPSELQKEINFDLNQSADNIDELEALCKSVIKYSVKTNSPNFFNQLYGGCDVYGYTGTLISESLNTNQYTFEVAPFFSVVEQYVLKKTLQIVGYNEGDGIFSPGGSISNMYALVLARYSKFPEVKTKGLHSLPQLAAFTSEDGHYSILKAVHWLGLGTDNLIKVKADKNGKMIVEDLETKIKMAVSEGLVPFFVNATAGTTVLGAIDPLDEIADICEKYKIWFHVDACYGGTLILSSNHNHKLKGIERSDSLAWNPHKMLGAPLQCSIFITKKNKILHECNSASAKYLFQQDKFYDVSYDTGDKSIQCGRKVDAFKLWLMWKARGDLGFEMLIDNAMDCARYFKEKISFRDGFRLIQEDFEISTVCFWYIPKRLRGKLEDESWWKEINLVAPKLKEKLIKEGTLMIGYSPLPQRGLNNFFRMVTTCQPPPTFIDMDYAVEQIEKFGEFL